MPPRAPSVTARLAAALPSKRHMRSSASSQATSLAASARSVTCAATRASASVPFSSQMARYKFSRPMPETTRSTETWGCVRHKMRKMSASRSQVGDMLTCPPSPAMGTQSPLRERTSDDTPKPVPGPIRPLGASATGWPEPICCRSLPCKAGAAMAMASQSLSIKRLSSPSAWRVASMENCQWLLVIFSTSPSMGLAMAMHACCTRGWPTCCK